MKDICGNNKIINYKELKEMNIEYNDCSFKSIERPKEINDIDYSKITLKINDDNN